MSTKLYKVILFFLLFTSVAFPIYNAEATDIDVNWTDLVGVSTNWNNLTKTASTSWGNSGAASTKSYTGDLGLEFTATETNKARMCGLSDSNTNANYTSIDYAIYLLNNATVQVYENGTAKWSSGTYQSGDVFKVNRSGTTITYKKNGTTFYTSTVSSSGSLLADTALYTNGATLTNVKFTGVTATAPDPVTNLGVDTTPGALILDWTAAFYNGSAITGYDIQYGTVTSGTFASTYTDDAVPGATISGLTNGTQYHFKVIAKNSIGSGAASSVVYGTPNVTVDVIWTDLVGASAVGNDLTKTASSSWGNGGAASTLTQTGTFGVEFTTDSSAVNKVFGLSDTNTNANYNTIDYAVYINASANIEVLENGVSKGTFGGYITGDKLKIDRTGTTVKYKKNDVAFYTSATASSGALLADSALYYVNSKIIDARFIGVSPTAPAVITDLTGTFGNGEVTLNWSAPSNNGSAITSYKVEYGLVSTGTFDLTYTDNATPGATITGLVNGTHYQFRVVALNAIGSGLPSNVVKLVPNETIDIVWANLVGVSASGNDITKTAGNGWGTGGATSDHYYNGNIAVSSIVDQLGTNRMIGFSSKNLNSDYTTIEYAIYLYYQNSLQVYENGTYKAQGPAFQTGDVVCVRRTDGVVEYLKNGVVFYTSAATTTKDLLVDTAIYTYNGKISDVRVAQHGGYSVTNEIKFGDTVEQTIVTSNGTFGYEFYAQNNDKLVIPLANSGGSFSPKLELFNPSSTKVSQVITTTGTILNYTTQTTGTFSLVLSDDGANQTGTFNFTLQKKNTPGQSIDLDFGEQKNETMEVSSDVDAFKISALAGDTIAMTLETGSTYLNPQATLFDSSGNLLDETTAYYGVDGTLGYSIASDGNYYVLVKELNTSGTGYYTLALEENLVTGVSHTGSAFDPAAAQTATINFFLDRNADVTIKLYTPHYGSSGYWRTYYDTILDDDPRSAGSNSFVWDGKNSSGNIVPSGGYVYTVETVSPGRTDLYDPVYVYGFVETNNGSMTPANFDPNIGETATISYDLPVPAFVSIDIGVVGTNLPWRRLIETAPRDDGTNTEIWDGRDTSGQIMGFDNVQARGWAVLLPDNTIIVGNNAGMAVDSIEADPYAFFPVYGEATQISFDLSQAANVTLEILDTNDNVVITLIDDAARTAGVHTVEWDGKNELNKVPVEQGLYTIRLTVSQTSGPQVLVREGNVTVFR